MAEMTLEEAFAAATVDVPAGVVDDVFVIDAPNRKIIVPDSESVFGVETDKDAERKYFRCPRIVGDNVDLSQHKIYVVYVTAKDVKGTFFPDIVNGKCWCDDVAVDGDCITFSWKLSDNVMTKAGIIAFKILAVTTEDGKEKTRWNTAPAYGTVLMTVPDGDDITERYPDIVTQLLERMDAVEEIATEEAMQGYVDTYFEKNPVKPGATDEQAEQIQQNTQNIDELKGDMDNVKSWFEQPNLLPNASWVYDKFVHYQNGEIINTKGYAYTTVDVNSENSYYAVQIQHLVALDADGTYIGGSGGSSYGGKPNDFKYLMPANAKYVCLSTKTDLIQSAMFGIGESATDVMDKSVKEIIDIATKSLHDTSDTMQKEIQEIKATDKPLEGLRVCCYGTSITEQGNTVSGWIKSLADKLGVNCINNGMGGTRVSDDSNISMSNDERLSGLPNDVNVYLVEGAINDWLGWESFDRYDAGLRKILSYLQTNNPTAVIICWTPHHCLYKSDSGLTATVNNKTLRNFADHMIAICKEYHVPCVDMNAECGWGDSNISTYVSSEYLGHVHPNKNGGKRIASILSSALLKYC